ncbi:response regulator [Prauserella cavernicola]|uniref:Transcriptional regulatory protein n=1 Tax=Prauserella cavernicola TaxID=2800127 RepID=A0A934R0D4_9PSEU|nr:response regulator [Prauserella cavernicola]MBK1788543.1 response regulator [Prauserella cavernicola]
MINVLVVEDDPVAADAHRQYVERVAGFTVAGVVHAGNEAVRFCGRHRVDLVLLDFYLPDTHGLAVCQALRAAGTPVDVIAVTSARDLAVVRAAVSAGVVQYLLKPFTFASLRDKLERYAMFREHIAKPGEVSGQADVDRMLATLRTPDHGALPKGMSGATLDAISAVLVEAADGLSAAAVATSTGVSRVTARRYLEYLADNGLAERRPHYGSVGRPEVRYSPLS